MKPCTTFTFTLESVVRVVDSFVAFSTFKGLAYVTDVVVSVGVFCDVVYFLFTQFSAFWMNWVAAETAQNSCGFRDSPTTFRARDL